VLRTVGNRRNLFLMLTPEVLSFLEHVRAAP